MNKWEKIKNLKKDRNKKESAGKEGRNFEKKSFEKIPIDLEILKNKMTEEDEAIQVMRSEYREKLKSKNEEQRMLLRMKVSW
jgi:hypothetical protein